MKTEYQVRNEDKTEWTDDIQHLRENCRTNGATLWRHQSETEEEANKRRLDFLDTFFSEPSTKEGCDKYAIGWGEPIRSYCDRLCPPPATTEVQVDWDTLEPVPEVFVEFLGGSGLYIARGREPWPNLGSYERCLQRLCYGEAAIGPTRETALRNLAEFQAARKGAAK